MNIIIALKQGCIKLWACKRVVLILYIAIFLMSLCVAYPLKKLLETTVGHSLMVQNLMKGFDYEFFNDFSNAYGFSWTPIFDQSVVIILLFLLLYVFLSGGIYAVLIKIPQGDYKAVFWGASASYFWRILRLSIFFALLHSAVFAVFALVFYGAVNAELQNEGVISTALKIILPIYYAVALFFFVWQDYAKYYLLKKQTKWILQAVVSAFKFIKANLIHVYALYFVNMIFWAMLVYINYRMTMLLDIDSTAIILVSFFISQLFVVLRLFLKTLNIASIVSMADWDSKTVQDVTL